MFLWNQRCMTYLLESQGLDLFRPFIFKILGTVNCDLIHNNFMHSVLFFLPNWDLFTLLNLINAVIFMRGLILLHVWGGMGSFFTHQIYLEALFLLLSLLILDLLDFSLPIL
jgi:hypothetical protein